MCCIHVFLFYIFNKTAFHTEHFHKFRRKKKKFCFIFFIWQTQFALKCTAGCYWWTKKSKEKISNKSKKKKKSNKGRKSERLRLVLHYNHLISQLTVLDLGEITIQAKCTNHLMFNWMKNTGFSLIKCSFPRTYKKNRPIN